MILISRLIWDEWNIKHIGRHNVTANEVEEVCHGDPIELKSYKQRVVLVGPSQNGKILAIVLDSNGNDVYYPVTARAASRKERRWYQEKKGVKTNDKNKS